MSDSKNDIRDKLFEEYNYNHALCPKCNSDDFTEGNIAYTVPSKNINKHVCNKCGWIGLQKDLKSRDSKNDI